MEQQDDRDCTSERLSLITRGFNSVTDANENVQKNDIDQDETAKPKSAKKEIDLEEGRGEEEEEEEDE